MIMAISEREPGFSVKEGCKQKLKKQKSCVAPSAEQDKTSNRKLNFTEVLWLFVLIKRNLNALILYC